MACFLSPLVVLPGFCRPSINDVIATMGSIEETVDVIPTIDLTPWLNDDDSSAAARIAVVKELHDACVTYGFFQLVGHGIPLQLQKKVLSCAANFFDLPLEEKMNVSIKKCMGRANRGYEVLQGQTLQTGALPDLKEVSCTCHKNADILTHVGLFHRRRGTLRQSSSWKISDGTEPMARKHSHCGL